MYMLKMSVIPEHDPILAVGSANAPSMTGVNARSEAGSAGISIGFSVGINPVHINTSIVRSLASGPTPLTWSLRARRDLARGRVAAIRLERDHRA